MINVRKKGAAGERELCAWLGKKLNIPTPTRNLEQVRSGGSDIIEVKPFFFEVKRVEILSLQKWWDQVHFVCQEMPAHVVPIVAFRQNGKRWEFLIPAKLIDVDRGFLRVTERVFIQYASAIIDK